LALVHAPRSPRGCIVAGWLPTYAGGDSNQIDAQLVVEAAHRASMPPLFWMKWPSSWHEVAPSGAFSIKHHNMGGEVSNADSLLLERLTAEVLKLRVRRSAKSSLFWR
jgi:hypothetical protein